MQRHPNTAGAARYGDLSIALHWAMLVLIALTYAFTELRVLFERGTPERDFMRTAHFSCELLVLGPALLRLGVRVVNGAPPISPPPPASSARTAPESRPFCGRLRALSPAPTG